MKPKNFAFMTRGDKVFVEDNFGGVPGKVITPGVYTLHVNRNTGQYWFQEFKIVSDSLLDLPSPEYTQVTREMQHFLKPATKEAFKKLGYLYKRSALLYGPPGTGKTCIVNRVAVDAVASKAIVLYTDNIGLLKVAFQVLSNTQPDTPVLVIFEEFDKMIKGSESELLTLLDGQEQKENVMYLATTNYIEKIPKRLYRPGRFSSIIEVGFPIPEARKFYFEYKLGTEHPRIQEWTEKTNGCSVDELKEIIQSIELLGGNFETTIKRIQDTRDFSIEASDRPEKRRDRDDGDGDNEFEGLFEEPESD